MAAVSEEVMEIEVITPDRDTKEENGVNYEEVKPEVKCEKAKAVLTMPAVRKPPCSSPMLTSEEIAQEILARAEKKRQYFPDGMDVLVAMKSPSELRYFNKEMPSPPPPKISKVRDKKKVTLDTNELLSILQDGAETHYVQKPKPKVWSRPPRGSGIDPELEKSLAIQQLKEFSWKKGRSKNSETNNNEKKEKPKKKEVNKATNRELQMLLQDEGAVNMLYSVEKGQTEGKERLLSSKTRLKKVLKKKAEEVKEAIIGSTDSPVGVTLRNKQEKSRKASVDSDSEHSVNNDFSFPAPAEASKIIRRHSSSSSYSSRGSSPRRLSIDDKPEEPPKETKSPIKMSEKTEKLIEMKCKELNLQKEHSEIIRKLVVEKKNGLKERLQNQFSSKFKAAVSSPVAVKTESKLESPSTSPPKPVWKVVEEDWESYDENSDVDCGEITPQSTPIKPGVSEIIKQGLASVIYKNDKKEKITGAKKAEKTPEKTNDVADQDSPQKKVFLVNTVPAIKHQETKTKEVKQNEAKVASASEAKVSSGTDAKNKDSKPSEKVKSEKATLHDLSAFPGTDVRLERLDSIVRIYFAPRSTFLPQSLNSKVLGELCQVLDLLSTEQSTSAVIFDSSAVKGVFCNGIDLPSLLSNDLEIRKCVANQTAMALRDFICKLCMFGKPILTAVSGKAVGLGVIMLAYCDYVISDETATFYTPYSRLGYVPEAAATLSLPHVIGHRKATSLLLGCSQLDSSEAEQCGLVSKVVPRIVLESRLMEVANTITKQSTQTMISTKALLMHTIRTRLPNVLNMEIRLLEQHWSSDDCQERIRDLSENPLF